MKKFLKGFITFILLLSLGACGKKDKEPKAVDNAEFDEYSSMLLSIMYDIGLVDMDEPVAKVNRNGAATLANNFEDNKDEIWDIIENEESKQSVDIYYSYLDVFEQTFYIPLIMGDALKNYYGVSTFYGVKSNTPFGQYVMTTSNNNVNKTTYVYSPVSTVFETEMFLVMDLNYTNVDNYRIESIMFNPDYSRLYYACLDDDGKFFFLEHNISDGTNYSHIRYSNGGFAGYEITDMTVINNVKAMIMEEFSSINNDSIRDVGNNVKYNVSTKHWNLAMEKYLPGAGLTEESIIYSYADSENTILASIHTDGTVTDLVIPRTIRYLSEFFVVSVDNVNYSEVTLTIPSTVVGIKNNDMGTIVDVDVEDFKLNTANYKAIGNIIVEEGSTLFRSGEGHLYSTSGKRLYTLNVADPTGVLNVNDVTFDPAAFDERPLYTNSIHTVNFTLDEDLRLMDLTRSLSNLRTINITGECASSCNVDITTKSDNLTVNLNVSGQVYVSVMFDKSPSVHKVNVLNSEARISYGYENGSSAKVTLPWSKSYYDLFNMSEQLFISPHAQESDITFATDAYDALSNTFITVLENNKMKLEMTSDNVQTLVIPEDYYGRRFTEVNIRIGENKIIDVTLPSSVTKLYINADFADNYGKDSTIRFNGTLDEFKTIIQNEEYQRFRVNLICNDYTGVYSHYVIQATLNYNGTSEIRYVGLSCDGTHCEYTIENVYLEDGYNTDNYDYYYLDNMGMLHNINIGYIPKIHSIFEKDNYYDITLTYGKSAKASPITIIVDGRTRFEERFMLGTTMYIEFRDTTDFRGLVFNITPMVPNGGLPGDNVVFKLDIPEGYTVYFQEDYTYVLMAVEGITLYYDLIPVE